MLLPSVRFLSKSKPVTRHLQEKCGQQPVKVVSSLDEGVNCRNKGQKVILIQGVRGKPLAFYLNFFNTIEAFDLETGISVFDGLSLIFKF
jgi:hypothetical protein